jgi:hypothetical protein
MTWLPLSIRLLSVQGTHSAPGAALRGKRDDLLVTYRSLQARDRALREQGAPLWKGSDLLACAWWQKRRGWQPKRAAVPGETRQGMCPACFPALTRALHVSMRHALPLCPSRSAAGAVR